MNTDTEPGVRQPPVRSGRVSTAFVQLLDKYGASPRLLRKVGEVTDDRPGLGPVTDVDRAAGNARARRPGRRRPGVVFALIAGADPDLLESLPSERVRYQTLGVAISLSAVTATVLFGMTLVLVGFGVLGAVLPALSWGILIFVLDRWFMVTNLGNGRRRWLLARAIPRLVISAAMGVVTSTPIILAVFRPAIDAKLAVDPDLRGRTPGFLDRLDTLEQLSVTHPAVQLAHWSIVLLIVAMDAAPVLAALALRRRPGAYEITASMQERYFPAERELAVLHQQAWQCGTGTEPESDLARELATMTARIDELTAEIGRTREQTSAEIIDLATRQRRAG